MLGSTIKCSSGQCRIDCSIFLQRAINACVDRFAALGPLKGPAALKLKNV